MDGKAQISLNSLENGERNYETVDMVIMRWKVAAMAGANRSSTTTPPTMAQVLRLYGLCRQKV
ncbi:hypothetical protein RvY_11506 [Ramazzottius varieornatus]|uniref:Uncharacterized protein n=1 Tax=Ramazzottius varieornatus TaxID=947166 RepID=A0A1D1VKN8_RAMVA|nr:hypothetical protein RvY_11506 [Ramazzottius varieornatus]